ncbi:hypothetical protein E4U43_005044 [Claviceps pusilla]|uniref:Uncharacterized protein n=1 Tax=Claviceps pusilla TaxID=123648 RepID=A0A9P7NH58_9HYPO|nr:hypothetical protein E4U43_005044 [Claviceps pusilla]
MSTTVNPVESWLDHIQESIIPDDDDLAKDAGLDKDKPPRQVPENDDGETSLRRAHKQGSQPTALIPQQSSAGRDRAGDGLNLARPGLSDCSSSSSSSRPAVQSFGEEFVRKPRRKTRPDRYETRNALASDKNQDDGLQAGRKARRKIRLRSGKEVMSNFTSENICRDTLIRYVDAACTPPGLSADNIKRAAVADLMCYDFDLGHGVRRLSSSGRVSPYVRPMSCDVSPRLKERSRDRSPIVGCESPLRHDEALSHLERPLIQPEMTSQNAAPWPKALNGASSPRGEISTTLKLANRVSPAPRSRRLSKSKRYMTEEPLHQSILHPFHKLAPISFETKAQHRPAGVPGSDTFRPCKHDSATFQTRSTASMESSRVCIDLGGGHCLNLDRLRNRGLYRADRVPVPSDETTIMVNKSTPRLQHTRDLPVPRLQRQVVSACRRARYFDDKRDATDLLRRRFSRRGTSTT